MDAQETQFYNAVLVTAFLIGAILLTFVIVMYRQHKKVKEFFLSKIDAEIKTLENERQRVSSDLHDDLGPILTSIKFRISSMDLAEGPDKDEMIKALYLLDKGIGQVRSISKNLFPDTLLRKGLVEALSEFISDLRKPENLNLTLAKTEVPKLSNEKTLHCFRVLQEVIHNTFKHSQAKNFTIALTHTEKSFLIETWDDGIGFEWDQNKPQQGLGMRNLLSRMDILKGQVFLETELKKGTHYLFTIPLNS